MGKTLGITPISFLFASITIVTSKSDDVVASLDTPAILIVNLNRDVARGADTVVALDAALDQGEEVTRVPESCHDGKGCTWSTPDDPMRMLPFTAEDNATSCTAICRLRYQRTERNMLSTGPFISRWPAVDASHPIGKKKLLAQADVHTRYLIMNQGAVLRGSDHEIDAMGPLGCSSSHYQIWSVMEDLDLPFLIVVEDDVRPTGVFVEDLRRIDADLLIAGASPERFDLLLLGWRFLHRSHPLGKLGSEGEIAGARGGNLRRVDGLWHGTHAYLVTRRGARRLRGLMRREGIGGHLDHWSGEANAVEEGMVVIAPLEPVLKTVGASTLGHGLGCFSCKYKDIMVYVLLLLAATWLGIVLEWTVGLRFLVGAGWTAGRQLGSHVYVAVQGTGAGAGGLRDGRAAAIGGRRA